MWWKGWQCMQGLWSRKRTINSMMTFQLWVKNSSLFQTTTNVFHFIRQKFLKFFSNLEKSQTLFSKLIAVLNQLDSKKGFKFFSESEKTVDTKTTTKWPMHKDWMINRQQNAFVLAQQGRPNLWLVHSHSHWPVVCVGGALAAGHWGEDEPMSVVTAFQFCDGLSWRDRLRVSVLPCCSNRPSSA